MTELETLNIPYRSEEWFRLRKHGIGGSDAACILGLNKWKSAIDLWKEKTGKKEPKDLSGNSAVEYGKNAEDYLAQLFALDYPQFRFIDTKNIVYRRGFLIASLDGELLEIETGLRGFLEIKTTEIRSASDRKKWDGRIPDNYFAQILHYFITTDFDFAYLKVQMKEYDKNGEVILTTKHYRFDKKDYIEDMAILYKAEKAFYDKVKENRMPTINIPRLN